MRILLVEDELDLASALGDAIRGIGYLMKAAA